MVSMWLMAETLFFCLEISVLFVMFFFSLFSIIEKGEEKCTALIEAHKDCMRQLGFKI